MFDHFNVQLWLAVRGVAGELPFHAESDDTETLSASLAVEAAKFRKNRR